jgi:restriction system protein
MACDLVADDVDLSPEARQAMLPSGLQQIFRNRIGWAHDRLKRRGLSEAPKRGTWRITTEGKEFQARHPGGIDENTLREITHYEPGSRASLGKPALPPIDVLPDTQSPEERIDGAVLELNESLAAELLEQIMSAPPEFFERLVLDVLHAMGYGVTRADLEETGGSGDGGIDGIITLDKLGLEKVYVQAKRWASGNVVGRPQIQGFYGALAGRRARKGVYISTSSFSAEARVYAANVSDSLVLVDGAQLTALMIEYEVGVAIQRSVKIGRVDSDYFDQS